MPKMIASTASTAPIANNTGIHPTTTDTMPHTNAATAMPLVLPLAACPGGVEEGTGGPPLGATGST
jgi:hypothetical protein